MTYLNLINKTLEALEVAYEGKPDDATDADVVDFAIDSLAETTLDEDTYSYALSSDYRKTADGLLRTMLANSN